MELTFDQSRVLGAMIEKAMTTPANYPMSLNAVVVACNQVSNREPITEFSLNEVELVLRGLADVGLVKMVHRPGDRVVKYRQALDDQLQTNAAETALLAVLMLRGPQTPGELRQRTIRYVEFAGLTELEQVLGGLAERHLVRRLDRQPGQKEARYEQLLTDQMTPIPFVAQPTPHPPLPDPQSPDPQSPDPQSPRPQLAGEAPGASPLPTEPAAPDVSVELADLKRRFEDLLDRLGEDIP